MAVVQNRRWPRFILVLLTINSVSFQRRPYHTNLLDCDIINCIICKKTILNKFTSYNPYCTRCARKQFGPDEVEEAGVRLGAMHFGASSGSDTGEQGAFPSPAANRINPDGHSAMCYTRKTVGSGGGSGARATNNATPLGSNINSNGHAAQSGSKERSAAAGIRSAGAGGAGGAGVSAGGNDHSRSCSWEVGATMYQSMSAMNQERLAAERAFGDMDQNSGRVSTPRFEELLTLLGIPEAQRKGEATASARAAGLLSAYSFARADFIAWCVFSVSLLLFM